MAPAVARLDPDLIDVDLWRMLADWIYQGVVTLHQHDAQSLADNYDFRPAASIGQQEDTAMETPLSVWPDLRPFLPTDARWLWSQAYNDAPPAPRWRTAFLDVEHQTLFFILHDH